MKTIILADAHGDELSLLTNHSCKALLPVAGKPVIAHTLEILYRAGIRTASVFAGSNKELLDSRLSGGTPWGMQLEIQPWSASMDSVDNAHAAEGLLLVRGDELVDLDLVAVLQETRNHGRGVTIRNIHGRTVALLMDASPKPGDAQHRRHLVLPGTASNSLDSLQAYHRANMEVMRGNYRQLTPAGIELSYGIWSEPGASLARDRVGSRNVFIGSTSHVHQEVRFSGDSVISERVLIDRQARLCNTVILPDTYVGAFTDLSNSIVRGNLLVRVDTGVIAEIGDSHVLADITPACRGSRRRQGPGKRLIPAWKPCA